MAGEVGPYRGLVMAYQVDTEQELLLALCRRLTGPLLVYEVPTALFLEAGFLA
jgi:cytochrome bd-type quinol oxidase subunit 1